MTRGAGVALPEMECDLVKRTTLPFFGFREPEPLAIGIMIRALSAKRLLTANFSELVHELRSSRDAPR
jgi:hypothetical protein